MVNEGINNLSERLDELDRKFDGIQSIQKGTLDILEKLDQTLKSINANLSGIESKLDINTENKLDAKRKEQARKDTENIPVDDMIRNINGTNKNTPSKDEIDKKFIEATERFTQKLENGFFNDREFTDQEFDDMLKGVQEALEKDPQKDVDAIVEQQLNSKQNEDEKEKTLDLLSSQSDERRKEAVNLIERANSSGVIEEIGVSIDDYKNNLKKSIEEDKAKGKTRGWMNSLSSLTREDLAKEEHESALANAESPYDVFGNNCVVDDESPSLEEISGTVKKQRELELKYENTDASI